MNKAPDAFRTISEVADYLETPAHVLRFWETRFPQVKPVKGAGGRRYYRPSDVALLAGIRRLLHTDGMTIRGVQKILRDQGVRHVAELGGEVLPDPEPLEALLPPARPEAEVVPLRRDLPADLDLASDSDPDLTAEASDLDLARSGSIDQGTDPESDLLDPDGAEPPDPAELPAAAPKGAVLTSPAMTGFGGFALDLDVPRAGGGGFIAFANGDAPASPVKPEGFVHPEARPKREAAADRQASLFDLSDAAPLNLVEDDTEAPHVFVDDDEAEGAEVTAFPRQAGSEDVLAEVIGPDDRGAEAEDQLPEGMAPEDLAPEDLTFEGLLPEDVTQADMAPDDMAPDAFSTEGSSAEGPNPEGPPPKALEALPPLARAVPPALSAEAAVQALLDESPESAPGAAPAPLAGLTPRLRRLPSPDAQGLFALADLQARLGLLHAQMVEAAARPRRPPGE